LMRRPRIMSWWLAVCAGVGCANHHRLNPVASSEKSAPPLASAPPSASAPPNASALARGSSQGDFEPEDGSFGFSAPDPYEMRLHEMLLAGDHYRVCELVTLPSFTTESAVYIVVHEPAPPLVVSRTLKEQLWGLMMNTISVQSEDSNAIAMGPAAQAAALAKIPASSDTERAELDQATVDVLSRACESVLMRASYHGQVGGFDGTIYHAGNWQPGVFVAGRVWSPESGTIAGEYIALAESLRAYAASAPRGRNAIKAELLAKAKHLLARATVNR